MAISEDLVREKLKNVVDPELFVNIVDLGLIYEVRLKPAAEKPATEAGATSPTSEHEVTLVSETPPPPAAESTALPQTDVFIEMTMTSPACPAGPQLISGAKREVSTIDGVSNVEVKIVLDPPWTPDRMTEDAKDQLGIF